MTRIFVDTSAWMAIADVSDSHHRAARDFNRDLRSGTRLITTNYVLAESYTWVRYKGSHGGALAFHGQIRSAISIGRLEVGWITPELQDAGWQIFEAYRDQALSFTDCTSAVVAREHRVDYVFSFDSDFRILGFDVRP